MPRVTFIKPDGSQQTVDAEVGKSVMEVATGNMIPGIIGDCGGCMTCSTCHCYVDEAWFERLPPAAPEEKDMVECALDPGPTSRLGCQIKMTDELDGLVVRVPASQA